MTIYRKLYFVFAAATAISALIAAGYWFASSRLSPEDLPEVSASIDDNPSLHILTAQSEIYSTQAALREASRLNKWASLWSGASTVFAAAAAVLGMM